MLTFYRILRRQLAAFVGVIFPDQNCRFTPTCSAYCQQAYRKYGPLKGTLKCAYRILRCSPFSSGGHDPA